MAILKYRNLFFRQRHVSISQANSQRNPGNPWKFRCFSNHWLMVVYLCLLGDQTVKSKRSLMNVDEQLCIDECLLMFIGVSSKHNI
jgi:hypothetical protein